jgi:hypothetical protein
MNYMTQSTHSSVFDYRRRDKYYIWPPDFETSKNTSTMWPMAEPNAGGDGRLWV